MRKAKRRKGLVVVGSDHAGFRIKEYVKSLLREMNYAVEDVGTYGLGSVDYPVYAEKVAAAVVRGRGRKGILACGTGVGASIAANKVPGVRAALVTNERSARLSREHNNANILVLGGRPFNRQRVKRIVKVWLESEFKGGRHARRVRCISRLERKYRGA